jgi:peptide/nickel transport system permease protein
MNRPPQRLGLQVGIVLIGLLVLLAVLAPWLTPYGPNDVDAGAILEAPSFRHWAGTDSIGRDLMTRILHGGRVSLLVAFGITGIGLTLGGLAGCSAGLIGGWLDTVTMRCVDVAVSIPAMVIALALTAALGPSLVNLVLVLGMLGAPYYARLLRGETLSIRERPFVRAAYVLGAGHTRVLFQHVIPNLAPVVATIASSGLAGALMAASALSFVGLGAQPPQAEWGALIYEGRNSIMFEWWCAVLPGVVVVTAALGFTLIGDGLRDKFDPRGEQA